MVVVNGGPLEVNSPPGQPVCTGSPARAGLECPIGIDDDCP
jgi:hypothetical protein